MARRLSMDPRAVEKREERARARAEKRASLESGQPAETPEIEVEAAPPTPPKTLKDRLFGFIQAEEPKKAAPRGRKPAGGDNLVVTMLPTVAASFIATYSRNMLAEEYRECAPKQEEVAGMLTPIMSIIGRRVEVVGKASQDAIDMANALVMGLAYATRASITYMDIKRGKHEKEAARTADDSAVRANQRASAGIDRSRVNRAISEVLDEAERLPGSDGSDVGYDASENDGGEADLVAEMLHRDRDGRARLGLLPGTLPGSNHRSDPTA